MNSCFYKPPRESCVRERHRRESSSHIFREFVPAQQRVRLNPIETFVLNAATAADEQRRPRKINSCFYKTLESHRPVQTSARREIVHIFRVYPPAQRRVRLNPIETFALNAATGADEQRRPRKMNSCFYKPPRESCVRERHRRESSSHIFREFVPAQQRVRLNPIETFVLNAATAADEQRRPRKINSCFYKTLESHRPVQTSARREIVHIFRVYPPAQRRVRLNPIETFALNAATGADEQRRPRKMNSCFYKPPRESCVRERHRRESSSHIFREFVPAQQRVRLNPIETFVLNAATAADEQRRPRKINSCFYKTLESHRPVQTSARREIVHIFRVYPPAQRRVRLNPIETFALNAATGADEQRRPRKMNSCFYKPPRESCVRERHRGESSSHIFREFVPAQQRVRLNPIETFVLNAATAADEQRRPRKINSCFYKTLESHRPVRGERSFTFSESTPPRNGACD